MKIMRVLTLFMCSIIVLGSPPALANQGDSIPARDFILVRHGETNWTIKDIPKGPLNLPLNETGRQQAAAVYTIVKTIADPDQLDIYCSPLLRTRNSMAVFEAQRQSDLHKPLNQPVFVSGFKEYFHGDYRRLNSHGHAEGRECKQAFQSRVLRSLQDVLRTTKSSRIPVIFMHQGVFQYIAEHLCQTKAELDFSGLCHFQFQNGTWTMKIYKNPWVRNTIN